MWRRSQLKRDVDYIVQLCQNQEGIRYLDLREATDKRIHPDMVFETGIVPFDLVWDGGTERIGAEVGLADGTKFACEAHGMWLTLEEYDGFLSENTPWCTKVPPRIPPK